MLPLYKSSTSGSPAEWLVTNNISLLKFIDIAEHLDQYDKTACREFAKSEAVYKVLT